MDKVMWECDYPHSDSTWPTAPETLALSLGDMSDHDIDRITHLNAMKHFSYDPFTTLGGKENCTVAALRSQAVGHDVSIVARAKEGAGPSRTKAADLAVTAMGSRRT
jgi:hypothetical protein